MKIDKKLKITMTRSQICDLMKACTYLNIATGETEKKWKALHDELLEILNEYDHITLRGLESTCNES